MKKYFKRLTAFVMAFCMVVTCLPNSFISAKDVPPVEVGDKLQINFHGINLNPRNEWTSNMTSMIKATFTNNADILINPTANANYFDLTSILNGLYVEPQKTETIFNKENTYYDFKTEQVRYVNGEKIVYRLVGFKEVGAGGYDYNSVDGYLNDPMGFCYEKEADALANAPIKLGSHIGIKEYNAINHNPNTHNVEKWGYYLDLAAVYTTEKENNNNKGTYTYDEKGTDLGVNRVKLEATTEGIDRTIDFDNNEIVYTIPENFDGNEIQITADDELVKLLTMRFGIVGVDIEENPSPTPYALNDIKNKPGIDPEHIRDLNDLQPGKSLPFNIRVVNLSKNSYGYKDQSLVLTTSDLQRYLENNYTSTLEGKVGFDGQKLVESFTPTRTMNMALSTLVGNDVNGLNTIIDDSLLGKALTDVGYNGIEELNHFYIDFYNNYYGTNYHRLEEFGDKLAEIFSSDEASTGKIETNKEVAETMYNYFYNYVFAVYPNEVNNFDDSWNDVLDNYTLGKIMRKVNNNLNSYMKKSLPGYEKNSLSQWAIATDGLFEENKGVNIFNNMDFSFDMGFKLEKKVGDVTVTKNIDLNGAERNENPSFIFKLTDRNGTEYFKTLSFDEGELEKSVTFEDIPYGEYKVEEISSIRYEISNIENAEGVISDSNKKVKVEVTNRKEKDNDFSDSSLVVNSFKKTVSADGKTVIKPVKTEHNNKVRG